MLSRRTVVAWLVAAPVLGLATPHARADKTRRRPAAPAWYAGDTVATAAPGTITALRGKRPAIAKLGRTLVPRSIDLTSVNNTNSEFTLWVVFPRQPADGDVFLSADGAWFQSDSYGHDDGASQASFQLDRPTAERLARALAIPLGERAQLGDGLQATWTFPPKASTRPDDPIPVKLHVTNAGKATVGFAIGGRQRGARDNRFTFSIARNGTPVAIKEAPDFGGIMYYKALKPGEAADLTVDLRSWADLSVPGHYEIDAKYEGELSKDGLMPSTATERKNLWDLALLGQGGILVP